MDVRHGPFGKTWSLGLSWFPYKNKKLFLFVSLYETGCSWVPHKTSGSSWLTGYRAALGQPQGRFDGGGTWCAHELVSELRLLPCHFCPKPDSGTTQLGLPVVPFYLFFGEGSPAKIGYRKSWYPSNLPTGGPRKANPRGFKLLRKPGEAPNISKMHLERKAAQLSEGLFTRSNANPGSKQNPWLILIGGCPDSFSGDSDHFWREHPMGGVLLRSWVKVYTVSVRKRQHYTVPWIESGLKKSLNLVQGLKIPKQFPEPEGTLRPFAFKGPLEKMRTSVQ